MKTKQVIVLRKDLKMRKGKMVAQGAHASMAVILDAGMYWEGSDKAKPSITIPLDEVLQDWLAGTFTKICVGVDSEQELLDIHRKATEELIPCSLIQDKGLTEFGGVPTYTAVAVGPDEEELVNKITGHLILL